MTEPVQLTPPEQTPRTPNHEPTLQPEFSSQVDQTELSETTIKESNTVNERSGKVQPSHFHANKRKIASVQVRASQRISQWLKKKTTTCS